MALTISVHSTLISIGDMVRLSQKIKEGEKERIQNFEGMVIAIKGNQGERTITVRRIGAGAIGIEKIIPVDLPSLSAVVVLKHGNARRSKLYFLRDRIGKEALQLPEKVEKAPEKPKEKSESKESSSPKPAAWTARRTKSSRVSSAKKKV